MQRYSRQMIMIVGNNRFKLKSELCCKKMQFG